MMLTNDRALEHAARVEALLATLEASEASVIRDAALEGIQALVQLYGEGLARIVASVNETAGSRAVEALARDDLVSHLLLLHGLHPVDLGTRVEQALAEVRPYLASHGGDVQLLGIEDGVARLRLQGSCRGCPSSTDTLRDAVERAIERCAPDLDRVEAEGADHPAAPPLIPLMVDSGPPARDAGPRRDWIPLGPRTEVVSHAPLLRQIAGVEVLLVDHQDQIYAYQARCPGCGASLTPASVQEALLTCAACRRLFDLQHAGRCPDAPDLQVRPVPLLVDEAGEVQIAPPSTAVGSA